MIPVLPGNQLRAFTAVSPSQSEQGQPQAPRPTLPHLWGCPWGASALRVPQPLCASLRVGPAVSPGVCLSLLLFVSVHLSLSLQPPVPSTQGASELQPQGWAWVPAQPCPQGGLRSRQRPHLCLWVPQAGRSSPGLAPGSAVRVSGRGWVGGALLARQPQCFHPRCGHPRGGPLPAPPPTRRSCLSISGAL